MIFIYHRNDLDGICSAAIGKLKYPDIKLVGLDNDEVLDVEIGKGEEVIMADISLPMEKMKDISIKTKGKFTWIDHHQSSINDFNNYEEFNIKAVLRVGIAACELTWETLFPNTPVPLAVKLLSSYDVWDKKRFDWDKLILPFQYGMRLDCGINVEKFNTNIFKINLGNSSICYSYEGLFQAIYNSGINILKYQKEQNELHAKIQWFETDILGYRAICINDNTHSSFVFDTVYDENKYDLMVLFYYAKNRWSFSFYTTKENVDCSLIAKHFGGGGHKAAAGCKVKNLSIIFTNREF